MSLSGCGRSKIRGGKGGKRGVENNSFKCGIQEILQALFGLPAPHYTKALEAAARQDGHPQPQLASGQVHSQVHRAQSHLTKGEESSDGLCDSRWCVEHVGCFLPV